MKFPESIAIIALLALTNLPLLWGGPAESLLLLPEKVLAGQWWRIFTHPWVHVSGYHLFMDALGFILLWHAIREFPWQRCLAYLAGIHVTIVATMFYLLPHLPVHGYCGLSGIDHGLMTAWSLLMLSHTDKLQRKTGLICLVIVLAKSTYEMTQGKMLFSALHLGSVGNAIPASHAAGIVGAVLVHMFTCCLKKLYCPGIDLVTQQDVRSQITDHRKSKNTSICHPPSNFTQGKILDHSSQNKLGHIIL